MKAGSIQEVEQSLKKKHIASEIGIPQSTLSTALKDKEKLCVSYVASRTALQGAY